MRASFFTYGLTLGRYDYDFASLAEANLLAGSPDEGGTRIETVGQAYDGEGQLVSDAMIEIWQVDRQGRYSHPNDSKPSNSGFKGFGRFGTGTDEDSSLRFTTVKTGSVDDRQAPYNNVVLFARGML